MLGASAPNSSPKVSQLQLLLAPSSSRVQSLENDRPSHREQTLCSEGLFRCKRHGSGDLLSWLTTVSPDQSVTLPAVLVLMIPV